MSEAIATYLVIAEDGTSHEHHHRMTGTETIENVVSAVLGGRQKYVRVGDPALALWCDGHGGPRRRPANMVGSLLVLLLGGGAAVLGPVVITGMRGDHPVSLTAGQVQHLLNVLPLCRR